VTRGMRCTRDSCWQVVAPRARPNAAGPGSRTTDSGSTSQTRYVLLRDERQETGIAVCCCRSAFPCPRFGVQSSSSRLRESPSGKLRLGAPRVRTRLRT